MNAASATQLPRKGDIVGGKFVIDRLLGQGGMGAVFAATHRKLGHAVAIKIMLADSSNPEAATRFMNEGRNAAQIQSEHVVRVEDVDEEMGYAYMVLELLDGEDAAQLLDRYARERKRLPTAMAVGYVLQALQGIMQAHALGIVHRDLKPSNLFLARRKDGTITVKVLDFGISKSQNQNVLGQTPSQLTSTKAMLGSPLYMSPEQLRSSKSVDHRADIWALGVILYELLSGALPFMGENLGELFAAILETEPTPLQARVPDMPAELDAIVLRCLHRNRDQRFQNAAELTQSLLPFASTGAPSYSQGVVPSAPLAGTAVLSPGAASGAHRMGGSTPNPAGMSGQAAPPPGSAITGSGPRMIGGTMHLGAMTPQSGIPNHQLPHAQTNSAWDTGGSSLPRSKAPFILIGVALAVFATTVGMILIIVSGRPRAQPTTASSASASAAAEVASAVASEAPPPAPPASSAPAPAEVASAASGTPEPPPMHTGSHSSKPSRHGTAATNTAEPATAKPAETKPPEVVHKPTAPTATPANGTPPAKTADSIQQNHR